MGVSVWGREGKGRGERRGGGWVKSECMGWEIWKMVNGVWRNYQWEQTRFFFFCKKKIQKRKRKNIYIQQPSFKSPPPLY